MSVGPVPIWPKSLFLTLVLPWSVAHYHLPARIPWTVELVASECLYIILLKAFASRVRPWASRLHA